jgi:hypothetical protein
MLTWPIKFYFFNPDTIASHGGRLYALSIDHDLQNTIGRAGAGEFDHPLSVWLTCK